MKVNKSFPTNYPCNQAVHRKGNRFVVILDKFVTKAIANLYNFYSLNW